MITVLCQQWFKNIVRIIGAEKKIFLTWILCREVEASATLCGTSKHLAVLILALTNHCWKSLRAARNLCSNKRSLFWHSLDARRLRLEAKRNVKDWFNMLKSSLIKWTKERRVTTRGSGCCLLPMCSSKQRGYMCRCSDTVHTVLTLWRRRWRSLRDEKWAGGEMAKWVKWKQWALGQRGIVGDGGKGYCVGGGWEATYEWGKSSQGWQDGGNEGWQIDAGRKRVRWRRYGMDTEVAVKGDEVWKGCFDILHGQ